MAAVSSGTRHLYPTFFSHFFFFFFFAADIFTGLLVIIGGGGAVETHWKREGSEGLLDCVYVYMDVYTCMCTWMRGRGRDTV